MVLKMSVPNRFHAMMSRFAAIVSLGTVALCAGAKEKVIASNDVTDSRPKVCVIAHGATVDGQSRSDVAQAIGDSIGSYLMKQGGYRVFQPVASARPAKRKKMEGYGSNMTANVAGQAQGVEPVPGSDFVYTFSLFGEGESHRLTLKKVEGETAEVVGMEETTTHGGLDMMFTSIPIVMSQLESKGRGGREFPVTQSPAEIRETIRSAVPVQKTSPSEQMESPGLREFNEMQNRAPNEYGGVSLSSIPKALTYQPLGAIQWINDTWKFCIIHPQPGHRFAVNQSLDVLYDEDGLPYGSLSVDALDSGKVVAGFGRTPSHHPLFRGDVVYGWAPPLK